MKKEKGFTLAEVLVTLVIIGVVAAITIPTLMQNYKQNETSSKLKKFYSMMKQVYLKSELDNGKFEDWENNISSEHYFTTYLAPYLNYMKTEQVPSPTSNSEIENLKTYLLDGTTI